MNTKRIYNYAFVSSPLLTLFGVSPLYIFGIFNFHQIVLFFFSILFSVLLYWVINSYLFIFQKKKIGWKTILVSYVLSFLCNIIKIPFFELFSLIEFRNILFQYVVYPIITTIALNTIILLMINLILREAEQETAQRTIADLSIQKLEAENQTLMQQLQPHFLFNALSILKSLIKENAGQAEIYSIKLSEFLRYAVDSHKNETVTIREEMQFVTNYVAMQKVRFENAFEYTSNVPEEILGHNVPVLAIQTLAENAFKHNYFTEKRPLQLTITYANNAIVVSNNIVSLKVTERAGTGLVNLEKRYQFIANKKIEIKQTEDSFFVSIPVLKA